MTKRYLIQFAKRPVLGGVKTRLAKTIGDREALDVHRDLTLAVNSVCGSVRNICRILSWGSLMPDHSLASQDGPDREFYAQLMFDEEEIQVEGDLGVKLYHSMSSVLNRDDPAAVVVVGSDCPSIDEQYIDAAFSALDAHDVVLGPAEDGGYVLIGAKKLCASIFKEVEWGGSKVLAQTVRNLEAAGYGYILLAERWDVDEVSDLKRWRETNSGESH